MTVVPEQPVIEAGTYRLIRHPSSTGLLIMFLGFGLSSTSRLSLLALMGCALLGFSYRIHVEETFHVIYHLLLKVIPREEKPPVDLAGTHSSFLWKSKMEDSSQVVV